MKKKEPKRFITQRDLEILKFLWRWKAVSTAALAKKFYPEARPFTAYERLLKLEKARYIKSFSFRHRLGVAWMLGKRGYRFLFPYLLEMKKPGYGSENPVHDFYSTAFHLGEWLTAKPSQGHICSELELLRLHPDLLPPWAHISGDRRPDGYSLLGEGNRAKLYAFEAELSMKAKSRYDEIISFYDEAENLTAVFWLVASPQIQKTIQSQSTNASRPRIHHFLQLNDFKKLGWLTPINGGLFEGKTLTQLLLDGNSTEARLQFDGSDVQALLQSAKRPMI